MNKIILTGMVKNIETRFINSVLLTGVRFVLADEKGESFECIAFGKEAERLIKQDQNHRVSLYGTLRNYKYMDVNRTIHRNKYILIYNFSTDGSEPKEAGADYEAEIEEKLEEFLAQGQAPFSTIADAYA